MSEVDALEHDLLVSEQRLFAELERKRAEEQVATAPEMEKSAPGDASPSPPPPSAAPAPAAPAQAAPAEADEAERAAPRSTEIGRPCDLACRALASMKRSAEGICSITGDSDERCTGARARVQERTTQVLQAGCACRSGS